MSEQRKFVCGFYGARDAYEVPLALQEAGLLASLLTDFYGDGSFLARAGLVRAARQKVGLPAQKVCGSLLLTAARNVAGRLFRDAELQNHLTDQSLSRRIGRQAARLGAHIFTYEPYAVPRPPAGFPSGRRQVVFFYHPHVDTEDAIYQADQKKFPEFYGSDRVTDSPWRRRTADAWKHADLVICASSFTKRSLAAAGMEEERIAVVPYGTSMERGAWSVEREGDTALQLGELTGRREDGGERHEGRGQRTEVRGQRADVGGRNPGVEETLPATSNSSLATAPLRLLFVGRNPLRKGLHHLLMAWNAATKRPGNLLTIVCAAKPLEVQRLAEGRNDVLWLESVSAEELARLYGDSDALVVPSLCEGFGHVYLEAMGRGCAVVGTSNSALPDIGDENQGVFTLEVGDLDALGSLISRASADPSVFRNCREAARRRASEFTWSKFRQKVAAALYSLST